jgi:ankyrin repeat protein
MRPNHEQQSWRLTNRASIKASTMTMIAMTSEGGSPIAANKMTEESLNALVSAMHSRDTERALAIIKSCSPDLVTMRNPQSGSTLLMIACEKDLGAVLDSILLAGGTSVVNEANKQGNSALHFAARSSLQCAQAILHVVGDKRAAMLHRCKNGQNALAYACSAGRSDVIEFLLTLRETVGSDFQLVSSTSSRLSCLMLAVTSKEREAVSALLRTRDTSLFLMRDRAKNNVLLYAVNALQLEILADLLKFDEDLCSSRLLFAKNQSGSTVCEMATSLMLELRSRTETPRYVLEKCLAIVVLSKKAAVAAERRAAEAALALPTPSKPSAKRSKPRRVSPATKTATRLERTYSSESSSDSIDSDDERAEHERGIDDNVAGWTVVGKKRADSAVQVVKPVDNTTNVALPAAPQLFATVARKALFDTAAVAVDAGSASSPSATIDAQFEEMWPVAASLDVRSEHVLGFELESLSMAQLECVESLLDVLAQRMRAAKMEAVKRLLAVHA